MNLDTGERNNRTDPKDSEHLHNATTEKPENIYSKTFSAFNSAKNKIFSSESSITYTLLDAESLNSTKNNSEEKVHILAQDNPKALHPRVTIYFNVEDATEAVKRIFPQKWTYVSMSLSKIETPNLDTLFQILNENISITIHNSNEEDKQVLLDISTAVIRFLLEKKWKCTPAVTTDQVCPRCPELGYFISFGYEDVFKGKSIGKVITGAEKRINELVEFATKNNLNMTKHLNTSRVCINESIFLDYYRPNIKLLNYLRMNVFAENEKTFSTEDLFIKAPDGEYHLNHGVNLLVKHANMYFSGYKNHEDLETLSLTFQEQAAMVHVYDHRTKITNILKAFHQIASKKKLICVPTFESILASNTKFSIASLIDLDKFSINLDKIGEKAANVMKDADFTALQRDYLNNKIFQYIDTVLAVSSNKKSINIRKNKYISKIGGIAMGVGLVFFTAMKMNGLNSIKTANN
ncbi:uncharacterized protein NESG_01657 [Nematocida ausubeli]|uniref:Uncharacterized protein n=1 Tax=Nematocida ausubeli (strain ATCC PRA-371 / ERTm2) TaxID=1913371 RepID=A0A086J0L0_NEMA1|nr:uncharacterized protein NESG_01657 [Nematocida ausubeli]KAI5134025.1 hypothetical protein NEAUS07_0678 [Nematocida ausubeli]KFG25678.1 hypothetical protein NESG_01657 [Nematocida ausubeli]